MLIEPVFGAVLFNCWVSISFRLTSTLTLLSKRLNCYKITLECLPKNVDFYKKFGYLVSEENYMFQRFFN